MAIVIRVRNVPEQTLTDQQRTRRLVLETPLGEVPTIHVHRQDYTTDQNNAVVSIEKTWLNHKVSSVVTEFVSLCPEDVHLLSDIPAAIDRLLQRKQAKAILVAANLQPLHTRILQVVTDGMVITDQNRTTWTAEDQPTP